MKEYLIKITQGTLQHIKGIDNIVDMLIFIVAAGIVIYTVAVVACGLFLLCVSIIDALLE